MNELQKWATGLSVMDPNNLNINFGNLNVPPAPDGANPLNLGNGAITPAQIEAMNNHTSNYTGTMSVSVNVTGDANSAIDKQFLTNTIASVVRKQISNGLEVVTDGTNIEVVLKE